MTTLVQFEGEFASVERVIEYLDLPAEGIYDKHKVTQEWPSSKSKIEVSNLNFRYRPELDLTLKNL